MTYDTKCLIGFAGAALVLIAATIGLVINGYTLLSVISALSALVFVFAFIGLFKTLFLSRRTILAVLKSHGGQMRYEDLKKALYAPGVEPPYNLSPDKILRAGLSALEKDKKVRLQNGILYLISIN